jgi:hypothetical protein
MGPVYKLFIVKQAVGADLVYFDMFNATGSGVNLEVHSVQPVVSGAVAVTGVVAVDLHLTRTTAVGTGGTAATHEGTDKAASTICRLDNLETLNGLVTARLTPTGGATAGALLGYVSAFSEETNAGTYLQLDLVRQTGAPVAPVLVRENTGIRVVQGAVASVGNVGFVVTFSTTRVR